MPSSSVVSLLPFGWSKEPLSEQPWQQGWNIASVKRMVRWCGESGGGDGGKGWLTMRRGRVVVCLACSVPRDSIFILMVFARQERKLLVIRNCVAVDEQRCFALSPP